MALQCSDAVRNAWLDALESTIGASAILKLRTGPPPATVAAPDSGTVLATLALPADWMAAAVGGAKVLQGVWTDPSADASATAGHFRLYASDGITAHLQGTVGPLGGTGDLVMESVTVSVGTPVTVGTFTLLAGNA